MTEAFDNLDYEDTLLSVDPAEQLARLQVELASKTEYITSLEDRNSTLVSANIALIQQFTNQSFLRIQTSTRLNKINHGVIGIIQEMENHPFMIKLKKDKVTVSELKEGLQNILESWTTSSMYSDMLTCRKKSYIYDRSRPLPDYEAFTKIFDQSRMEFNHLQLLALCDKFDVRLRIHCRSIRLFNQGSSFPDVVTAYLTMASSLLLFHMFDDQHLLLRYSPDCPPTVSYSSPDYENIVMQNHRHLSLGHVASASSPVSEAFIDISQQQSSSKSRQNSTQPQGQDLGSRFDQNGSSKRARF